MSYIDLLFFIVVLGAICGLTPSLISIFCALISSQLGRGRNNRLLGAAAVSFFLGFIATMCVIGTSFWFLLTSLSQNTANYLIIGLATTGIVAGIIEIKDYFWYGQGISHKIHRKLEAAVHKRTTKRYGLLSSFELGIVAVAASATSLGISLLLVVALLYSASTLVEFGWIFIYAVSLLLGLIGIVLTVISGVKLSAILKWKEDSKGVMRLSTGLAGIVLAWAVLLAVNHSIIVGSAL